MMTDIVFYINGIIKENLLQQALERYFHHQVIVTYDSSNLENFSAIMMSKYYPSSHLTFVCVTIKKAYLEHELKLKMIEYLAASLNCEIALHLTLEHNGRDCVLTDKHGKLKSIATTDDDKGDLHLLVDAPVLISKEDVIRLLEEDAAYLADLRSGKIKTGELGED